MSAALTRKEYWRLLDNVDYRRMVARRARQLKSDGCSGVADFYIIACYDHDIAYRTGRDIFGNVLTRAQADARLRWAIQHESCFGRCSPMSYWRWAGVRFGGGKSWRPTPTDLKEAA